MKRVFRQWLAGLLSVVLLFTLLPATALAEEAGGTTGQTTVQEVQALIDALPDAETITADNRADVEAQLSAIDEAKLALTDDEAAALDITRYSMAVETILALDDMSGADKPATIAVEAAYNVTEGSVVINGDGEYIIRGKSEGKNTITVNTSGKVEITLDGVTVTNSNFCAFDIKGGDVTLILADGTENTFISGNYYAGIHVAEGASLTIEGDGTLKAVSQEVDEVHPYEGTLGAGIGGNGDNGKTDEIETEDNAGSITINGGTIYATSEGDGAGIGGGWTFEEGKKHGQFQSITINGGTVYAKSERNGAGIGSGCWAEKMGTITITGGEIHAETGAADHQSYDIGAGHGGWEGDQVGGEISITGGVVYTENRGIGIYDGELTLNNTIIFSYYGDGEVYGDVTLDRNLTIESGQTLHIPEGSSLTVSEGHTLTVGSGAALENDGVLSNQGAVNGAGSVIGSGEFNGNLIDYYVSVTVPAFESVHVEYTQPEAQAITIQNKGKETVTISSVVVTGGDFTVEPAVSASVEVQLPSGGKYESYKIRPNEGLSSGIHTATVTVTYDEGRKAVAKVSFMVHHFAEGEGTSESPYQIGNLAELEKFRDYVNAGKGKCEFFKLTQSIDLGGPDNQWTPIGNGESFDGTFDGGGHTISGLYINGSSRHQGLFGYLDEGGTVKNLTVDGAVTCESYGAGIVGSNRGGTVENCHNKCNVNATSSSGNCGGVVGVNYSGTVTNCYNTGKIHGDYAGGITGFNYDSTVANCYNTGNISGGSDIGGVIGWNHEGIATNCYYLEGTAENGIGFDYDYGDGDGEATPKTTDEFASGEVAYLLQNGQETQAWGQKLSDGADEYPVLTTDSNKKVCKVTFATQENENYAVQYTNLNGTVTLPSEPTKDNYTFVKWSQSADAEGAEFDAETKVTGDMTVYAVGQANFGGESGGIALTTAYGTALTADLSQYVHYESTPDAPATGKFTYTITSGNKTLGAEIVGDELRIPKTANAGDYTLTIETTETAPEFTLMSVGPYGTDPVTLTVKVSIKKADSKVEILPTAAKGLAYTGAEQGLVTAGIATGGTVMYALGDESKATAEYSDAIPTGTNAGSYYVWWKVKGDANHNDTEPAKLEVTIGKAQAEVTKAPTPVTTSYTGDEITLVTGGMSNFGSLVYSLAEGGPFTAVVPTETEAGTYTVYYMVEGTDNWDASKVGSVKAEIKKAASSATVTGKSGLTYSGEAQELVTPGETAGGTVVYALGDNGTTAPGDGTFERNIPTGTNAGTYYVWWKVQGDANHNDTEPACITVTIDPAAITFQAVEVKTPYTGAAISVTVTQTAGEAPTIAPEKITVSYEQNGAAAEPIQPGTYDVLVAVTDPNFTLADGAKSVKVGTLTITHVHTYAEEWAHDSLNHWHACQGVGTCDAPRSDQAAHAWDDGVVTREPTVEAEGSRLYTCSVCGAAKSEPISKLNTFQISGVVTDHDGNPLVNVAIRLTLGQDTVAEAVTDDQGQYSFSSIPAGLYNVAATWETVTKTILVELSDADANQQDIQMPAGNVSSVVKVLGEDTPAVVVGGVDAIAEAEAPSPVETVTVTLTVEKNDDPADKAAIEAAASTQAENLTYLDITLTKATAGTGTGKSEEPITEAKAVLEIVIPFDFTNKVNVTAYRNHDNKAEALMKADTRADGTFRLDEAGGKIYIYASKFSTYAIGYTVQTAPTSYAVTAAKTEHGTVTADRRYAVCGRRVTLTARADEGYHLASLTVTYRNGWPVELTDNGDGTWTFVQPAGRVTVSAEFVPCLSLGFTDLDTGAWYHDYTDYVIASGLMRGVGDGVFAPDGIVTRAQMVTVLWNMSDKPVVNYYMTYSDVSEEAWYAEAVRWATSEGIVAGYDNGKFGPDDPITREQMAVMLYRYEQKYGDGGFTGDWMYRLPFTDLDQISDWAFEAVAWSNMKGVITGKDDNVFDPKGPAKRSEMAAILTRYCDEDDIT